MGLGLAVKKIAENFSAFTLIELLVVMALIGTLATLLLANFNAARERARDAQRKSDLRNIQTALRLYYNDYGIFPDNSGTQHSYRLPLGKPLDPGRSNLHEYFGLGPKT